MQWMNPPFAWDASAGHLAVTSAPDTDFWRVTRHGYIKDDGHFFYQPARGDFEATVRVAGQYEAQYDQAGIMLRENERVWLKTGIEFVDGVQQASAVVTRDFSDWSVVPLADNPDFIWIKILRIGSAVEASFSLDGQTFTMIREAYLTEAPMLQLGLMCCAPRGDGFEVQFDDFRVKGGE